MGRTGLRPHLGYMGVPRVAPRNSFLKLTVDGSVPPLGDAPEAEHGAPLSGRSRQLLGWAVLSLPLAELGGSHQTQPLNTNT